MNVSRHFRIIFLSVQNKDSKEEINYVIRRGRKYFIIIFVSIVNKDSKEEIRA